MDFKISLAAARVNADMTQDEAAEKLGVCRATLMAWEKGKTSIPSKSLMDLCSVYKCPIDAIRLPSDLTLR